MSLTYGSVCSGIEAVTCAWHDLVIDGQQLAPKWFSEIAEFPSKVLAHHWPSVPNLGDFTKIGAEHGPVDVLVGGTPCQAFSVAGRRAGLDDPRGHLAIEFLLLARRLRARWVVWENVPGVLSDDTGETLATFLGLMVECGYGCAYRVLDAQFTGVPQRRRRVFVVGHLGDWRAPVAVLLERPSMQGDPRPRGKAGTSVAVPLGVGATPPDRDGDGSGRGQPGSEHGVAHTLTAHHGRNSGEDVFALALPLDESPAHTIRTKARVGNCEDTFALAFHCTQDPISAEEKTPLISAEEKTPLISAESTGAIGVLPIQDSQRVRLRKQNGIGIGDFGDPMYTMTTRGDHAIFVASDGSATETDVAPTIGTDANRPARTMTVALDYQQGGEGAGVVREEVAPTMGVRADRAAIFAFDEAQITSADNRSTVSPGGPVPTVSPGGPVPTVSSTSRLRVASDMLVPRRLTPKEVERCFGFPDDYTNIPGAADSPRYEALGNSMAVPVMRWIGRRLLMVDGIVRAQRGK